MTSQSMLDKELRLLRMLHIAVMTSLVIMALILFFALNNKKLPDNLPFAALRLASIALLFVSWLLIRFVFNKPRFEANLSEADKLAVIKKNHIIKLALLEIPAILALVTFALSGDKLSLVYCAMALLLLLTEFPTEQKIKNFLV